MATRTSNLSHHPLSAIFFGVLSTVVAPALAQTQLMSLTKCTPSTANQVFGYLPGNTSSIVGTVRSLNDIPSTYGTLQTLPRMVDLLLSCVSLLSLHHFASACPSSSWHIPVAPWLWSLSSATACSLLCMKSTHSMMCMQFIHGSAPLKHCLGARQIRLNH